MTAQLNGGQLRITGYGRTAADQGNVHVAQTGETAGSVPSRAVQALESGDLDAFRDLYRRSRKLRLSAHGRSLLLSYGSAILAEIQLSDDLYTRTGNDPTATARKLGLLA
jgi:hypothetical protein